MAEETQDSAATQDKDRAAVTDNKDGDGAQESVKIEEKAPAKKDKSGGSIPSAVAFNDQIDILIDQPLPRYNMDRVKAYRAVHKNRDIGDCFAMVCERFLTPRIKAANVYQGIVNPHLVPLLKVGVVFWPPAKQQRYVFIFQDVLKDRLLKIDGKRAMGLKQDEVLETFIKPMLGVLEDFKNKDFVHGAIRPTNIFTKKGENKKVVVLGDALSVPPSYINPVIYETIERGMADPIGRGVGTHADDMYAFGVAIAIMMRSHDPLEGMDDEEIIRYKVEHGSYAALTGKDRFKGSVLELLRGLLHDDPAIRWKIDEVIQWVEGQRHNPKQSVRYKKAARPIVFNGKKYMYTALLAMDLEQNPGEARRIVEEGELEQWITRALEDKAMYERVETAIKFSTEGSSTGYQERLVANLAIALDPYGPIRFRGLRLMADAVGNALVEAIVLKQDIQAFAEMLSQNVVLNWLSMHGNPNIDKSALIQKFDACRNFMRQGKVGYGVERCIYKLSPETHCLSPLLEAFFVRDPEDLLRAFEQICRKKDAPVYFIDRHSAAFISMKDSKMVDNYLYELGNEESYQKLLGNVKCFATIQKRSEMEGFPYIAQAFADTLKPVFARYHDQKVREKLQKNIKRYAAEGDLVKIAGLLDNPEVAKRDLIAFRKAMREFQALEKEYNNLELRMEDKASFGVATGREVAAVISSVIAGIIILILGFMFISDKNVF